MTALITMLVVGVVARAFSAGLTFEQKSSKHRTEIAQRLWFEDQVTSLISGATLQGANAAFVSPIPASVNTSGLGVPQGSSLGAGSSSLVLTNVTLPVPLRQLSAKDADFETLNRQFGPAGGLVEVAFSMTAVGDPKGQKGLFLREQCPADEDLLQGGEDQVFGRDVQDIRFQFSDGKQWQDTWDSKNADKGKLPKLVKVRYQVTGEQDAREILVRLPLSDAVASQTPAPPTPPNGTPPNGPGSPPAGSPPAGGTSQ